jgi:hypothetical protein
MNLGEEQAQWLEFCLLFEVDISIDYREWFDGRRSDLGKVVCYDFWICNL